MIPDKNFEDTDSIKSPDATFSTPHGRQRSLWRAPLPRPLRHISSPVREILLRLHLRHCVVRFNSVTLDVCTHDTTSRSKRRGSIVAGAKGPPARARRTQRRPLLQHPHILEKCERAGILLSPAGFHRAVWGRVADGYGNGVCADEFGCGVVHVQQFRHVCQCGEDERHERVGGLSVGLVLSRIWDYGHLLESREWDARGADEFVKGFRSQTRQRGLQEAFLSETDGARITEIMPLHVEKLLAKRGVTGTPSKRQHIHHRTFRITTAAPEQETTRWDTTCVPQRYARHATDEADLSRVHISICR